MYTKRKVSTSLRTLYFINDIVFLYRRVYPIVMIQSLANSQWNLLGSLELHAHLFFDKFLPLSLNSLKDDIGDASLFLRGSTSSILTVLGMEAIDSL